MEKTPAQIIREGWMGLIWKTTFEDIERLQRRFTETKLELANREEQSKGAEVQNEILGDRHTLFFLAFTLLPYGQLYVMEDILENYSYAGRRKALMETTKFLFPIPDTLTNLKNQKYKDAFEIWFKKKRNQLEWSEELGKYIFKEKAQSS